MTQQEKEALIKRISELPEATQNIIAGMVANELSHIKADGKESA